MLGVVRADICADMKLLKYGMKILPMFFGNFEATWAIYLIDTLIAHWQPSHKKFLDLGPMSGSSFDRSNGERIRSHYCLFPILDVQLQC